MEKNSGPKKVTFWAAKNTCDYKYEKKIDLKHRLVSTFISTQVYNMKGISKSV